jgi:hypothetical protein
MGGDSPPSQFAGQSQVGLQVKFTLLLSDLKQIRTGLQILVKTPK